MGASLGRGYHAHLRSGRSGVPQIFGKRCRRQAGKQASRLHAGETPALPAAVTKDLSYTHLCSDRIYPTQGVMLASMSPELIAVLAVGATMLGVVVAVAGLILSGLSSIRADISGFRAELRDVHKDIGDLRERLARLEGMFEGFARSPEREPA